MTQIQNKNIALYFKENLVANPKANILILHGLAEHSGRYDDFVKILNKNNINAFVMDLRGHGKSGGKRGDIESIEKLLSDISCVTNFIKQNFKIEKLGLFGHSLGGMLATLYSQTENLDFLVLSSPLVYRPKKLNFLKFVPCKMLRFVNIKKNFSESKEMLQYNRNDNLALKKFSLRTIGVCFKDGINQINKIKAITCPTLLLVGKKDILLNETEKFEIFFEKVQNKHKKLIIYPDAKHRIVNNEGSKERIKDITDFILQQ